MSSLRQIMHKQMISQYMLMQECRRLLSAGTTLKGEKKRKLSLALLRRGFRFLEGQEMTDESGLLNVTLSLRPIAGSRKITGVLQALSSVVISEQDPGCVPAGTGFRWWKKEVFRLCLESAAAVKRERRSAEIRFLLPTITENGR